MRTTNILMVIGIGLLLSACSRGAESEFKRDCRKAVGDRGVCSCAYKKLEAAYGKKNLNEMYKKQVPPKDYYETNIAALQHCAIKKRFG